MDTIDLRSDTVTRPTAAMRAVMASAEVGDDVYGEDPTVNRLERTTAEMAGMEAALFVCSGTQSNLLALLSHCQRGDEYIAGQMAHSYRYEGGGAAVLGGIQPQPIDFEADGRLDLKRVTDVIKPLDNHFARTRLLCLENTQGGKVLPLGYQQQAAKLAAEKELSIHLDGARVFNAAVQQQIDLARITGLYDSVSICLSKGLGAPVGSVLCGSAGLIDAARRWRKVVGGGMRQAGILAAAGIHALQNHIARLAEDHENAQRLAEGLSHIDEIDISHNLPRTNMVFARVEESRQAALQAFLQERGILVGGYGELRLVTHLDISAQDIERVIEAFAHFFTGRSR
ncbi:MAG TPA: low-specificity L-threonine aldolase [Geopsychrobacteraceae bacterium]|nr:low-specificity L-threonine aldolase [Geopsychrobacteraceae bacterium]